MASASSVILIARVVNRGTLDSEETTVVWYDGSPEGEEIGRTIVPPLGAGSITEAFFLWELPGRHFGEPFTPVATVVDPEGKITEPAGRGGRRLC